MNTRRALAFTLAALFVLVSGTGALRAGSAEAETILLRVAGDDLSATTTVPSIAKRFIERRGGGQVRQDPAAPPWTSKISGQILGGGRIAVLIRASNTADGFRMLTRGFADIALAARPIKPTEIQVARRLGDLASNEASLLTARVGLIMAVNRARQNQSPLSFDQIREVYAGRVTDWSSLGGRPGRIHPLGRKLGSGARDVFESSIMGRTNYGAAYREFGSFGTLRDALRADPDALAYVPAAGTNGFNALRFRVAGRLVVPPEDYGLTTGDYPLSLRLALFRAPGALTGPVADFFHEAATVESEVDLMFSGFFRVDPELLIPLVEEPVPAGYRTLTHDALRVSTTIRFPAGSQGISPQTSQALDELATYLRFLHVPADKLRHIAFSDDEGSKAKSQAVSQALGDIVVAELRRRRVYPGEVIAFGTGAPLVSYYTPEGRNLNRRVETWIVP